MTIQIEFNGIILHVPIQISSSGPFSDLRYEVRCVNTSDFPAFIPLVIGGGKDLKPMLEKMRNGILEYLNQVL